MKNNGKFNVKFFYKAFFNKNFNYFIHWKDLPGHHWFGEFIKKYWNE